MEENALSARKHELNLSQVKQPRLLEDESIFFSAKARKKEDRAVQPALAVSEDAPNEKPVIEEMDERTLTARFEKRNVLDPHDPTFDIVIQQNEIVHSEWRHRHLRVRVSDAPCLGDHRSRRFARRQPGRRGNLARG
jgi:hypothetical protein